MRRESGVGFILDLVRGEADGKCNIKLGIGFDSESDR